MVKVLVTGANGQVGQALQFICKSYTEFDFIFCNSTELDITNPLSIEQSFSIHRPDYCINTAAYTAVDQAESEPEKAFAVNATGVGNLAEACKANNVVLLHISTDFVFDGSKRTPYTETDIPNPVSVYGKSKRQGEEILQLKWEKSYIIRTSWVYSQFGKNFVKTMLRLSKERDTISVVNDQVGTPTNAVNLAKALLQMIRASKTGLDSYGIYNFSDGGSCTWFDFATKIFESKGISINLIPISGEEYVTPAKRPAYSVLDKKRIERFEVKISPWEDALEELMKNYNFTT